MTMTTSSCSWQPCGRTRWQDSQEVLDASYDNTASVDAQAQKQYLQERGQDVSQMTETEILTANTGAKVFIASHVKFVDAMEDLQMTVNM